MNKTDRTLVIGVGAVIAYLLWQRYQEQEGGAGIAPQSGQLSTPGWIQQLSQYQSGNDYFTPQSGLFGRCQ